MTDRAQDTEAIRAALNRSSGPRVLEADAALGRLVARLEAAERERDEALAGWDGWQERCFAVEEELVAALAEPGYAGGGDVEPAAATSPGSASAGPRAGAAQGETEQAP